MVSFPPRAPHTFHYIYKILLLYVPKFHGPELRVNTEEGLETLDPLMHEITAEEKQTLLGMCVQSPWHSDGGPDFLSLSQRLFHKHYPVPDSIAKVLFQISR